MPKGGEGPPIVSTEVDIFRQPRLLHAHRGEAAGSMLELSRCSTGLSLIAERWY